MMSLSELAQFLVKDLGVLTIECIDSSNRMMSVQVRSRNFKSTQDLTSRLKSGGTILLVLRKYISDSIHEVDVQLPP